MVAAAGGGGIAGSTERKKMMLGFHVVGPDGLLLGFRWLIVRLLAIFEKIYRISENSKYEKNARQ
jgi:hypothetical protein